jgi:hypothetical protein
MMKRDDKLDTD